MAFKAIPVTAAQVSGSHTDFPVYIKPSAMTGWEALTLAEAQSIRFYSDEAKTTELAREVVSADEIHVKVPSLTTSTTIYADYDGIRADYATDATYGAEAVWGEYSYVNHNAGSSDSTSTGNIASPVGGITSGGQTGKIGESTFYDGVDDGFTLSQNSSTFPLGNEDRVYQAWVKTDLSAARVILEYGSASFYQAIRFLVTPNGALTFTAYLPSPQPKSSDNAISDDTYHLAVAQYVGSTRTFSFYVDGSDAGAENETISSNLNTNFGFYGQNLGIRSNGGNPWHKEMEEVRFRKSTLSPAWITTEYNNQNDVASFWGTVTDVGPVPVASTGFFAFV